MRLRYIVRTRTSKEQRWVTWRLPVESPTEALDLALECFTKEPLVTGAAYVDVRIEKVAI